MPVELKKYFLKTNNTLKKLYFSNSRKMFLILHEKYLILILNPTQYSVPLLNIYSGKRPTNLSNQKQFFFTIL